MAQLSDLSTIEYLWNYAKKEIKVVKPSNLNDLYATIENAWKNHMLDNSSLA